MRREEIGLCECDQFTMGTSVPYSGAISAYDWGGFLGCSEAGECHPLSAALSEIKQWAIELGDPELTDQQGSRHHACSRPLDEGRI